MEKIVDKVTGRHGGPHDGQGQRQSDSILERLRPASELQHEKRTQ